MTGDLGYHLPLSEIRSGTPTRTQRAPGLAAAKATRERRQRAARQHLPPEPAGQRKLHRLACRATACESRIVGLRRKSRFRSIRADLLGDEDARPSPDWRALEQAKEGDWLSLDRSSLQRENGLLYVWVEQSPLHYTVSSKGMGLTGRSQERLVLDCQQNTLMQVSQFYFGIQGGMAGGQLPRQAKMQPLAAAPDYQQKVFKAACLPEAEQRRLPIALPRTPLPVVLQTPEVPPQVIAAIDDLKLPVPGQVMRKLRYSYDAHVLNRVQAKELPQEVFISTDDASGQVLQHVQDPTVDPASLHLTFRGLFDLAAHSINKKSGEEVADGRPLIGLSFAGNWHAMPSGTEVSYTRTFSKVPPAHDGATSDSNTVTCRIGLELPASSIHPALLGGAKPFNCIRIKTRRMTWTVDYWYLSDYQLFVRAAENSPLGRWKWRIDSIE